MEPGSILDSVILVPSCRGWVRLGLHSWSDGQYEELCARAKDSQALGVFCQHSGG